MRRLLKKHDMNFFMTAVPAFNNLWGKPTTVGKKEGDDGISDYIDGDDDDSTTFLVYEPMDPGMANADPSVWVIG
jgi:hypothetical protein